MKTIRFALLLLLCLATSVWASGLGGWPNTIGDGRVLYADAFSGATWDAKISACITALPSTGGTCDARGLIGAQTWSNNISCGSQTQPVRILFGASTITRASGKQLLVFNGCNLIGQYGATVINGNDTTPAIAQGPSPGTSVVGLLISDLTINNSSTGEAIDIPETTDSRFYRNTIGISGSAGNGITIGGTGTGAYYNTFADNVVFAGSTGHALELLLNASQNQISAGQLWGGRGVYANGGYMDQINDVDFENTTYAVEITSASQGISIRNPFQEASGGILLDSGTYSNRIDGIGAIPVITDNSGNCLNIVTLMGAGGGNFGTAPCQWVAGEYVFGRDWGGPGTATGYNNLGVLLPTNSNQNYDLEFAGRYLNGGGGGNSYYLHAPLSVGRLQTFSGFAGQGRMQNAQISAPSTLAATVKGTPGSTTYNYWIACHDLVSGVTTPSNEATVTTGNATLNSSNYVQLTWTATDGCMSWDIIGRTNQTTSLQTNWNPSSGLSGTTITYNDQGSSTSGYTAPTWNSTGDDAVAGLLTEGCAGQQALTSGSPSTATVSNACITGSANVIECTDCSGTGAMGAPIRCVPSAGSLAITGPNTVTDTICWNRIQ